MQKIPVFKNQRDIITAFESALRLYYDEDYKFAFSKLVENFIKDYSEGYVDESASRLIYHEIFILDISMIYIYFLKYCQEHPAVEEITEAVNYRVETLFDDMSCPLDFKNIFYARRIQYSQAFNSENYLQTLAKMLQFIIDKAIYSPNSDSFLKATMSDQLWVIAEQWDIPNLNPFLHCLAHIKKTLFRKALPLKGFLYESKEGLLDLT